MAPRGALRLHRLAVTQQVIGQQIRFGQCNVRQLHAEVGRAFLGIYRLGAFAHHASLVTVAQSQAAMRIA